MNKENEYKCELVEYCPFFKDQMAGMPRSTRIAMEMFCKEEYQECARFVVFIECGAENVPSDLFPGEMKRARKIVSEFEE